MEKISKPDGVEDYVNDLKVSGTYDSLRQSLCNEIRLYVKEHYGGPLIGDTGQVYYNNIRFRR